MKKKYLHPDECPNEVPINVQVSICMITYRHEHFIAQAIEGVLMQKTNFSFELCIGEDDSPDRTREICKDYAQKYSDRIRLFTRSRDDVLFIDGRPTGRTNASKTRAACAGKYIAICEGDDYWVDELKLQKQFDFMEANPEYSLCFHPSYILDAESGAQISEGWKHYPYSRKIGTKGMLLGGGNMCPTNSLFFRQEISREMPRFARNCPVGDVALQAMCSLSGSVYYMTDIMSVYRKNVKGSWTSNIKGDYVVMLKHQARIMRFYRELVAFNRGKYKLAFALRIYRKIFIKGLKCGSRQNLSIDAFLVDTRVIDFPSKAVRILLCIGFVCGSIRNRLNFRG